VQPELVNVATEFLANKAFKIIEIEHGGACAARNAGFKVSTGEIVSFFNSDYVAKPGMARMWVDTLLAHPDCGFVYGGYEYATNTRSWYPSKQFDPWQLKQANYIDCGFPLWRKHVVEWDVNCKSLQDWDFWLRVVDRGVKGQFLGREISYMAEVPREGGLSMDSTNNWIDRVRYVKERNGIKESKLVVTSIGAPYHGAKIAQMLGCDYRDDTIFKPNEYKALYMIGFYMTPRDNHNSHADILQKFENVTKIVHFVGADIYWLRKFNYEQLKGITGALKLKVEHILCENEQAQKELADFGLDAKIVPIPPYFNYTVLPLPEQFKVAVFLTNHSDFDKYCQEEMLSIVRVMPDVQFTAYGDALQDIEYPNLKHVGNIWGDKWKEFVYDHSCYLRLVRHDTRPMASDEFILAGRDVVTNVPAPYVRYVDTGGKIAVNDWDRFGTGLNSYNWPDTKKKIVQTIRQVRLCPNYAISDARGGNAFYSKVLDRQKYVDTINELAGISTGKELISA
jgi:glycosyltransferase involved in cell wall biosynthesis